MRNVTSALDAEAVGALLELQDQVILSSVLFLQQFPDLLLRLSVSSLAEVLIANKAVGVDQVPCRPPSESIRYHAGQ